MPQVDQQLPVDRVKHLVETRTAVEAVGGGVEPLAEAVVAAAPVDAIRARPAAQPVVPGEAADEVVAVVPLSADPSSTSFPGPP